MKVKLSNYVAQFLVDHGIDTVFTVTGGGAMHLNDGFGKQKGLAITNSSACLHKLSKQS